MRHQTVDYLPDGTADVALGFTVPGRAAEKGFVKVDAAAARDLALWFNQIYEELQRRAEAARAVA